MVWDRQEVGDEASQTAGGVGAPAGMGIADDQGDSSCS
jgi:hypothetical protein